jgi:hypothetical protein
MITGDFLEGNAIVRVLICVPYRDTLLGREMLSCVILAQGLVKISPINSDNWERGPPR